jgi:hypothetical protein
MVDPSLLLSEEGLAWLEEDENVPSGIIIPAVFAEWLGGQRDLDIGALVSPDDLELAYDRRSRLVEVLGDFTAFSYRDERLSDRSAQAVLEALLLQNADGLGELRADEWAFLQSHSVLASKLRGPHDAFRDAGATIVEFGRKVGRKLIGKVIPAERIPPVLTPGVIAKATIKWIVVGGAGVGGGTLGGVIGTVAGGPTGAFIGSKALGTLAGALTTAACLVIDP